MRGCVPGFTLCLASCRLQLEAPSRVTEVPPGLQTKFSFCPSFIESEIDHLREFAQRSDSEFLFFSILWNMLSWTITHLWFSWWDLLMFSLSQKIAQLHRERDMKAQSFWILQLECDIFQNPSSLRHSIAWKISEDNADERLVYCVKDVSFLEAK